MTATVVWTDASRDLWARLLALVEDASRDVSFVWAVELRPPKEREASAQVLYHPLQVQGKHGLEPTLQLRGFYATAWRFLTACTSSILVGASTKSLHSGALQPAAMWSVNGGRDEASTRATANRLSPPA
jgi:hypothetical protein